MGKSNSKIQTLQQGTNMKSNDFYAAIAYKGPFRSYQITTKAVPPSTLQCILLAKLTNSLPKSSTQQSIHLSILHFNDMFEGFRTITNNMTITAMSSDEQYSDRYIYYVQTKPTAEETKSKCIALRPFNTYSDHAFCTALCQVDAYSKLKDIDTHNIHKLTASYILCTNIEQMQCPNTLVLQLEPIDATLSQIIAYRRQNKWQWRESQFTKLVCDLLTGLNALHSRGYAHNDIRPSTIYYSRQKDSFVIGSLGSLLQHNPTSCKIKLRSRYNAPQFEHTAQCSLQKADVYALGMTLLAGFYMVDAVSLKCHRMYRGKQYEVMKLIEEMVAPVEQRATTAQLLVKVPQQTQSYEQMDVLIHSLRGLSKHREDRKILAEGYCRLGLWGEWRKEYLELCEVNQMHSTVQVDTLKQLAFIQRCMGDTYNSSEHLLCAATVCREMGQVQVVHYDFEQAEMYFQEGLECFKEYKGTRSEEMCRCLVGLSRVYAYRNEYDKGILVLREALHCAEEIFGRDTEGTQGILLDTAEFEMEFGQFESASALCAQADKCGVRRDVVGCRIDCKRASYLEGNERVQLLEGAEARAIAALKGIQHNKDQTKVVIPLLRILAEVGIKLYQYEEAEQDLVEALRIAQLREKQIIHNIKEEQDVIQSIMKSTIEKKESKLNANVSGVLQSVVQYSMKMSVAKKIVRNKSTDVRLSALLNEKIEICGQLGVCCTYQKRCEEALGHYNRALSICNEVYGSHHNWQSAMTIGNMSRVYFDLQEKIKARECIKVACDILQQLRGVDDPDYEHFKEIEAKICKL